MGRPAKHDKRDIVNAIFFVAATGCQWRALPSCYPHWNTVHRYHVEWSRDGTWEAVADRLRVAVRAMEGHVADPSAAIIDARSVRAAATVAKTSKGYDAGKKISGRKCFGLVDTLGLIIAVAICSAATSDNTGGIATVKAAKSKRGRMKKIWCDAGFKTKFRQFCNSVSIGVDVVKRIHPHTFEVLPQRWIVERSWSWTMNNRRLQIDYERDPEVTEGFVWAAHSRLLLRRLTRYQ